MIDFKAEGLWPPPCEKERLDAYEQNEELFEGEHWEAFADLSAKLPEHLGSKKYLMADYPRLVSTVFADLLYGESPIISLPAQQEQVDEICRASMLHRTFHEAEKSASFRGDAVFKIRLDAKKQQVLIEEKPAYTYFAEVDPDSANRALSHCLAWEREANEQGYLVVEHHEPGTIYRQLFRLHNGRVGLEVPLTELYGPAAPPDREETGVPFGLLFHVPNESHCSEYYGSSDYTPPVVSLFDETNERLTKISSILDAHSKPKTIVPERLVDRNGNLRETEDVFIMIPTEANANLPRMLTWDGKLDSAFQQLEKTVDLICEFTELSPAFFGRDKAGSIESGAAMRQRFAATLAKVRRKRLYWQPVIEEMFWVAMHLQARWLGKPKPTEYVSIDWRDGLPVNVKETTDVAVAQVGAGFMSHHTAIRFSRQLSNAEADAEMLRIEEEQPVAPAYQPPAVMHSKAAAITPPAPPTVADPTADPAAP